MKNSDLHQLIKSLRSTGVLLEVDQRNDLNVQASKGALNETLIELIKKNKSRLVDFILENKKAKQQQVIPKTEQAESYPISEAQLNLWLAIKLYKDTLYNFNMSFDIRMDLDLELFRKAVQAVVQRHEILHTVFVENDWGEVRQVVSPAIYQQFEIPFYDFSDCTDSKTEVETIINQDIPKPFDLDNGPLIRAIVFKLSARQYIAYYSMHHLVSDGWSLNIISREVMAYYRAFLQKEEPQLESLDIQFKDFAGWEKNMYESGRFDKYESFWLEQLSGKLSHIDLPIAKTRPKERTTHAFKLKTRINTDAVSALKAFVETRSGSIYMGLLTALKILFYRYTNDKQLTFGITISGRPYPELQNQIGLYLNTLPLRSEIEEGETFASLFKKVRETSLQVYEHQSYSIERILDKIHYKRDKSHNPLFDFVVIMQNFNENKSKVSETANWNDYIEDQGEDHIQYDMLFDFQEIGRAIDFSLLFNSDLYEKESVHRFIGHFKQLLESALNNPDTSISELDYLKPAEKTQLLSQFNDTSKRFQYFHSVLDLFDIQVERYATSLALVDNNQTFSYKELQERSNQIAHYLTNNGVVPGDLVGLCMERSADLVSAILAVVKTGAAYVPIDPILAEQRISYIIGKSACKALLTDKPNKNLLANLEDLAPPLICLEEQFQQIKALPKAFTRPAIWEADLLYVIFTSGSTGQPKGVMVGHQSMLNLVQWFTERYENQVGRSTMMAGISFDAGALELWSALLSGSRLHVLDDATKLNRNALMQYFAEYSITHAFVPPVLTPAIVNGEQPAELDLKYILIGGDRLPGLDISRLGYTVVNQYGPTEATVMVTDYILEGEKDNNVPPPIGAPLANTRLYVLNDAMQLQPIGVPGELYIGGTPLAQGYWNDPDLTAEAFVLCPIIADEGNYLYRTGDIVKWRADGNLEFIRRKDDQVKIRGYRIELGDVEHALNQVEGVVESRVVVSQDQQNEKCLVAYFMGEMQLEAASVRSQLLQSLPTYMIPSYFHQLDQFPLTPNGKLDFSKLPSIDTMALDLETYMAPIDEIESKLISIWERQLHQSGIGTQAEFFLLGGNSIKLMQLVSTYEEAFGVKIPLKKLFNQTKIADHAQLIRDAEKETTEAIAIVPVAADYPVSYAQKRLWILSHLPGSTLAYNMFGSFEISGEHSPRLLEKIVWKVVSRHEVLRTVFRKNREGEPRQIIIPENKFKLDLQHIYPENLDENVINGLLEGASNKVFDLATGPLIAVLMIHLSESNCRLVFTIHHIICDGWSIELLEREFRAYYNAYLNGDVAFELSPLAIQYKDYASWQLQKKSSGIWKDAAVFWRNELAGELPVIDILTDKVRPAIMTNNGFRLTTVLHSENTKALYDICKYHSCSPFMGIMAALNILISRYSGVTDVIIGTAISGRNQTALENQVGLYLNTLPIRTVLDEEESYKALLLKIKESVQSAYQYQDYPLDKMIEDLDLKKELSRSPLFDILIAYQNYSDQKRGAGLDLNQDTIWEVGKVNSKFDLDLSFEEVENGWTMQVDFNTDLYDKAHIIQFINHFRNLLEEIPQNQERPLKALQFLGEEEQHHLLSSYNDTQTPIPEETFLALFKHQVASRQDHIAVYSDDQALSYRALDERSNQLAHYLLREDVAAGDFVPVCMARSVNMLVVLLGILKAGKAYVPIDVDYPIDRIKLILKELGAPIGIADANVFSSEDAPDIAFFEYSEKIIAGESKDDPNVAIHADDPAYAIYTSGSTGVPKGVVISHKGLANYMDWVLTTYLEEHVENLGLFSSLSFDFTITALFGAIASGGQLYVYPPQMQIGEILKHHLDEANNFSVIKLTPAHVLLIQALGITSTKIKRVVVGGEQLYPKQVDILLKINPEIEIYNEYGPTETTVGVCVSKFCTEVPEVVHIGMPITNTQIILLDKHQNLVPIGAEGELYIGGDQLAKGYYKNEELTNAYFVPHPFKPGEKLYKTGDIGKRLDDGNILFLGRTDDQVKINGYRVELGAIETALQKLESVEKAVVLVREDMHQEKRLVAYLQSNGKLERDEVKSHLFSKLPIYMVPQIYLEIEALPLTINGKIDRKALLAIEIFEEASDDNIDPATEQETMLVEIWKDVLNIEKIGSRDSFFGLGGNSIKLIQLVNRYAQQLSVDIELNDLFTNTTIGSHAKLIDRGKKQDRITIPKVPDAEDYPVSFAQRRMWILSQTPEGSRAYHMPTAITLQGDLDTDLLIQAAEKTVDRHEILRTIFVQKEDGQIRQKVCTRSELGFQVQFEDLSARKDKDNYLKTQLSEHTDRAFALDSGPLLRASLYKTGKDEVVAFYNLHHIIGDGWSTDVLIRDILAIYEQLKNNTDQHLPALEIQYRDFVSWQQEAFDNENYQAARSYWLNQLSGELPILNLPAQKKRPSEKTFNGSTIQFSFSKGTSTKLQRFTKENEGTLFMGLLAGMNGILNRYTQQNDIIIGTPITGRTHAYLEDQIGFYINTLALRTKLDSTENFRELFQRTRKNVLEAFTYQAYPFDELVNQIHAHRDVARSPVFDVMLTMQEASQKEGGATQNFNRSLTQVDHVEEEGKTSRFDLTLSFAEVNDQLHGSVEYNTDIYTADFIRQLIGHMEAFLNNGLADEAAPIDTFNILSEQEEQIQLEVFNDTYVDYPEGQTIAALFSEQVLLTPNKVALVFENTELTYQQLDLLSNQFAHFLVSKYQVENEDLIGIKLVRSDMMMVALLGILKAGGAYVPMDIHYPVERINHMQQDCDFKVIIDEEELEKFKAAQDQYPNSAPLVQSSPLDLAYVIYTSGSTGKAKGVMVEQRSVVRLVKSTNYYRFSEADTLLATTSVSFDVATFEYWGTLLNGSTLVFCSRDTLLDIDLLAKEIRQKRVNVMWFTTGWFNQLVETDISLFQDLKTVLVGGEKLSPSHIGNLRAAYNDLEIINGYGPTENTTFSTAYNISTVDGNIPIGIPISNSTAYIVNAEGNLQPIGVVGELWVGGHGVARGYLNRPELTAERFVPNPFEDDGQLYKTGDYARWLPDGNIEFLGRKDKQVKIRGYRIEIGEIEYALNKIPGITNAAVIVDKKDTLEKRLVGYVVCSENYDSRRIRKELKKHLPDFMLPSLIIKVDDIPTNVNGKVDYSRLPAPEEIEGVDINKYTPPSTPEEKMLAALYGNMFKQVKIGASHNFYELGGDSIKAIMLANKLKQRGYAISVGEVLQYPVIEDMALKIRPLDQGGIQQRAPVEGPIVLTPIQRWFLSLEEVNHNHFNQSVLLSTEVRIDEKKLRDSLQCITEHHHLLRARFEKKQNGWVQYHKGSEEQNFELQVFDLQDQSPYEASAMEIFDSIQESFDIEEGPLFKSALLHTPAGDMLLLVIHHLVVDGVSWRILLEDLSAAYQQLDSGMEVRLPDGSHSYQAWAEQLEVYANSEEVLRELAYWKSVVSEGNQIAPLKAPQDNYLREVDSRINQTLGFTEEDTTKLLLNAYRLFHLNINDILLSCLNVSLCDEFDRDSLLVEIEGHGREELFNGLSVDRTIGWFTTMYPVVLERDRSASVIDALNTTKRATEQVRQNGIGYGLLRYLSNGDDQQLPELRPADVLFNYLGDFGDNSENREEASLFNFSDGYRGKEMGADFYEALGLTFTAFIAKGTLQASISYSDTAFSNDAMSSVLDRFEDLVQQILSHTEMTHFSADEDIVRPQLPLSYNQADFIVEGQPIHTYGAFDLVLESFEKNRFIGAYQNMLRDFEVLRTKIVENNGKFYQELLPVRTALAERRIIFIENDTLDLSDDRVQDILHALHSRPFDLYNGETLRCGVVHNSERAIAILFVHHMILDDTSCKLLREYLLQECQGKSGGSRQIVSTWDYMQAHQEYLATEAAKPMINFWRNSLDSILDRSRKYHFHSDWAAQEVHTATVTIDEKLTESIRTFCREHNLLTSSFLLSMCFLMEIYRRDTGQPLIQVYANGREGERFGISTDQVVGQLVNRLPIGLTPERQESFLSFTRLVQQSYLDGRANLAIPIALINDRIKKEHGISLSEITDQEFNFLSWKNINFDLAQIETLKKGNVSPHCRVLVYCYEYENVFVIQFNERTAAPADEAGQLVSSYFSDAFINVLNQVIPSPETPMTMLSERIAPII